ncbi:MAG: hypothetical protein GH151_03275 [Bacteroidetes bacterium]|nr:hypothetical protein [Bacteroidota bacterium]
MKHQNLVFKAVLIITIIMCFYRLTAQEKVIRPLGQEIIVEPEKMPDYLWGQIKKDSFIKEHLGWKLAFCQHPMYFLIDEDRGNPLVAERIPPWGAECASDYAERVRRNLHSLDQFPELKLNYQWSAMEFQSLADAFPELLEEMKEQYRKGSLDFLDGTYSQAHLQVFGSESNWRQFEYGLEVYKNLIGKRIDLYARQETGLHLQLPQLLRNFGYKYVYFPRFPATIEIIDGTIEFITSEGRIELVNGDEFVEYVGLDGTSIPSYLNIQGMGEETFRIKFQQDLFGGPKLWSVFPDMKEIDQAVFDRYQSLFDFVRLGDALDERYIIAPPRAKARVFTYWSYTEGVWAEELLRKNKKAEETAVLAGEINSMGKLAGLDSDKNNEIRENWKTILRSQHHDVSWIEVTDLRRKSINRLDSVIWDYNRIMSDITGKLVTENIKSMAVFNGLPRIRKCMVELEGKKSLGSVSDFQEFCGKSIGSVELPSGGFRSFKNVKGSSPSREEDMPQKIDMKYYSVEFSEEGLIKQLTTVKGKDLLNSSEYLGGEIRARIFGKWVNNQKAEKQYYTGPVCDIMERKTILGDIPVSEKYYYFKNAPFIKVEVEFDFTGNEVGNMWIDKSKINIYYPTQGSEIYYDIPFGYTEGRSGRPLFPINWLYSNGLVYVNRGTTKHWVENGLIGNVVAWGNDRFTNRMHWNWISRTSYDVRLYGKQKIEYYLIPWDRFNASNIIHNVENIIAPIYMIPGEGEKSFYQINNMDFGITAIYSKDGEIWVRGYKIPSDYKSKYRDFEIFNEPLDKISK